jgi:hypothetical protein
LKEVAYSGDGKLTQTKYYSSFGYPPNPGKNYLEAKVNPVVKSYFPKTNWSRNCLN